MITNYREIICSHYDPKTLRLKPFNIVEYVFYYQSSADDKLLLDELIGKGYDLATKVNPGAANDSARRRTFEIIISNCVAGLIAEFCWQHFLNDGGSQIRVTSVPFETANFQIDLRTIKNSKTIEVRSSFPRAPIEKVICNRDCQFDVIGPYKNSYKPDEIQKDFYVRALFRMDNPRQVLTNVKTDNFVAYLTGGATWAMIADDAIAIEKALTPSDEISEKKIYSRSTYRVVPFCYALDTLEIKQIISTL